MEESNPTTLKAVAQRASVRHGGKGGRGLEAVARSDGFVISHSTIDKILGGRYYSTPGPKAIEALAALSGLSLDAVYAAAGEPLPVAPLADLLPPHADLLTGEQRRTVVELIRLMADQQRLIYTLRREAGDRDAQEQQEAAPITQADELAARRQSANDDLPAPLAGAAREAPEGGSEYDRVTRGIDGTEEGEQE